MPGLRGGRLLGKQVPSFIKIDNAEMRGMEGDGGDRTGGGAQTADTKPPPMHQ